MAIYAIIAVSEPEKLGQAIQAQYPDQHRAVGNEGWLVADDLTQSEVNAKLKLPDGTLGAQAVILKVSGYTGYAPSGVWEWLKSRLGTEAA